MGEDNLGIELISRDGILNALIPIMSEFSINHDAQSKIIDCIMNQKIAYNVENVVEALEEQQEYYSFDLDNDLDCAKYKAYKNAIDIVKRGGVDERT